MWRRTKRLVTNPLDIQPLPEVLASADHLFNGRPLTGHVRSLYTWSYKLNLGSRLAGAIFSHPVVEIEEEAWLLSVFSSAAY